MPRPESKVDGLTSSHAAGLVRVEHWSSPKRLGSCSAALAACDHLKCGVVFVKHAESANQLPTKPYDSGAIPGTSPTHAQRNSPE